jgi:tRNA (cytidine56-2'-O)-methyltransferase
MYGMPLDRALEEIPEGEDLVVIVGAEKVPADVYDMAHFNVAIGNQPHSEVAALALFLDKFFQGKGLKENPIDGAMVIHPSNISKVVTGRGIDIPDTSNPNPFEISWEPIPDREKCIELMTLLGASRSILVHIKEVCRLGLDMVRLSQKKGEAPPINNELLEAGLLLHDIGRTRTHSIRHVTIGAELSVRLNLDPRITSIIHNHPGGGVPGNEAVGIGLPEEDHIPMTIEEKIVCHSDNLVGSSRRRPLSVPLEKLRKKGAHDAVTRMRHLHSELEDILGIDIDSLLPQDN